MLRSLRMGARSCTPVQGRTPFVDGCCSGARSINCPSTRYQAPRGRTSRSSLRMAGGSPSSRPADSGVAFADGGPAVTLASGLLNPQWDFGVWRDDDVIVFGTFERLMQVPAGGGTPAVVTPLGEGAAADLASLPRGGAIDRRHHFYCVHIAGSLSAGPPPLGYQGTIDTSRERIWSSPDCVGPPPVRSR